MTCHYNFFLRPAQRIYRGFLDYHNIHTLYNIIICKTAQYEMVSLFTRYYFSVDTSLFKIEKTAIVIACTYSSTVVYYNILCLEKIKTD